MSVLTFPVTAADSADHGRSGVDGICLPTFPVAGAESPVHAYFEDDGISLPKYVFADASYHLFGVYSNFISSSSPYFFPNLPLHQGVVYIIRLILWTAVFDGMLRDRYGSQKILWPAVMYNPVEPLQSQIRDRYGIPPGVTQTNKQTPNERAWKLRALRYAFLP